jgi:hypothetical protein
MSDYIRQQAEARAKAWEEAKALLDSAAAEKRDLSAEENQTYDRIMADLDQRAATIESIKAQAEREERAAEAMKGFESQARPEIMIPSANDGRHDPFPSTRRNSFTHVREARRNQGFNWRTSSNIFLRSSNHACSSRWPNARNFNNHQHCWWRKPSDS